MNAYTSLSPTIPLRTRWEEARGTFSEKRVLLKIAAEELSKNGETWLFAAAMDAATRPEERDEHIARFEEELEAAEEAEFARLHLTTMAPAHLARIEREWEAAAVDPRERIV
jgi:hypothetical protein